jgi:uncharacterized protein YutE (UPF0331/DUF86 family)
MVLWGELPPLLDTRIQCGVISVVARRIPLREAVHDRPGGHETVTLRAEVIRQRLQRLRQILINLEKVRAVPRNVFVGSFEHFWLAERGLQLAAEILFDIGNHILAGHCNVHATDYEDVTEKLAVHGIISGELREKLRGIGGFRNILVHQYLDIDEERVHDLLSGSLSDFEAYAREIETFLEGLPGTR